MAQRETLKARLVHFVGFRDDRYWNAVRAFGPPDMVHEAWDRYAADDVAPGDLVVFAEGAANQEPRSFTVEAARSRAARAAGRSAPPD
ncbi:hypothetical protein [Parerythrobacter lacustris]|uniref:Uncharacterized protein n=1 Tax=Parerythrobacter lacustris TaxID=2969984 RepID=A0ABT1XU30_9SPHN|nr:hypothetical protein [Parerythrobacter lacustris]MCR2834749.1 hypothetical protein [Parerythrobacter lacustris]